MNEQFNDYYKKIGKKLRAEKTQLKVRVKFLEQDITKLEKLMWDVVRKRDFTIIDEYFIHQKKE